MSDKEGEQLDDYLINLDSTSEVSGVSVEDVDLGVSPSPYLSKPEEVDHAQSIADTIAAQKAAVAAQKATATGTTSSPDHVVVNMDTTTDTDEPKGKGEDGDDGTATTADMISSVSVEMDEVDVVAVQVSPRPVQPPTTSKVNQVDQGASSAAAMPPPAAAAAAGKLVADASDGTPGTQDRNQRKDSILSDDQSAKLAAALATSDEDPDHHHRHSVRKKNSIYLQEDEFESTYNNSRDRCSWLCCWRVPLINFPLAVLIWVNLVMMIVISLCYIFAPNARISNVPVTLWAAWVIAVFTTWIIIWGIVAKFLNWVERNAFRWMKLFYFTNNLRRPLTIALNGLINWLAFIEILIGIPRTTSTAGWWITKIALIMFIVFAVQVGVTIAAKLMIVTIQKTGFWRKMARLFLQERLVEMLMHPLDEVRKAKIAAKEASKSEKGLKKLKSKSGAIVAADRNVQPSHWSFDKVWRQLLHRDPEWRRISVQNVILGEQQDQALNAKVTLAAVACARRAFRGIDRNAKGFITVDDVTEWLSGDAKTARTIFDVMDKSGQGAMELDQLSDEITQIFESRELLRKMLKDQENMASILTSLIMTLFWIVMIIVALIILELDLNALLVPIASMLLTAAFVFGNSMKRVWESFVVVFLMDLFNVGDRIEVKGYPAFIVTELSLLTTRGFHPGGRHVTVPNFKMWEQPMLNYGRSKPYRIELTLTIATDTSQEVLDAVARRMRNWCRSRREVYKRGSFMFWTDTLPTAGHMEIGMYVLLHTNWQKSPTWQLPRSKLLVKLQSVLEDFGIQSYGQDTLRVITSEAQKDVGEYIPQKLRSIGTVQVIVHQAQNLESKNRKPADPVVKLVAGDVEGLIDETEFATQKKFLSPTNSPTFEEVFAVPIKSLTQGIALQVQNRRDEFSDMGQCFIELEKLTTKRIKKDLKLSAGDGNVTVSLQFIPK